MAPASDPPNLFLGLISGTSMDGIDAALVGFSGSEPRLLGGETYRYEPTLRDAIAAACSGTHCTPGDLATLDTQIGEAFAAAALALLDKHGTDPQVIAGLGSHGQNIFHGPIGAALADAPSTLQLGNPHVIAARTGIATVADFRRRDVALGGQGAPLAPALHRRLFSHAGEHRAVLNLGGIANLTLLPAGPVAPVTGFDTGPASCLMDEWVQRHRGQAFDAEGAWAAGGTPKESLLELLLADAYFGRQPPKSTGREYFELGWLEAGIKAAGAAELSAQDVQATLAELSARSVADALRRELPGCARLMVCGGGVHNTHLMERLDDLLAPMVVEPTDRYGLPADWVEAVLFAWLAREALRGGLTDLEAVTGAPAHIYGVRFSP
ncbi:MAG: anhydro-N-acetylmuramic acid kinase [Pseudomonadota bacterium]